jgi:hypothetical protein
MGETAAYPYATHLDIKFDPLTLIDVSSLARTVTDQWYNQTLCKVNESVIRLGAMQGEYHWHKHDNDDEFFFVLSGPQVAASGNALPRGPPPAIGAGEQTSPSPQLADRRVSLVKPAVVAGF